MRHTQWLWYDDDNVQLYIMYKSNILQASTPHKH